MQTLETLPPLTGAEDVADADITTATELLFLTSKGVSSHLMDVTTRDGVVELTGFTDSLLARQRAEEIALAVRGVRGVINELAIRTAYVPDAKLQGNVARALADDPATGNYNVQVTVAGGVITPTGTLQSWAEQELVLRVLRGVRGVRNIILDQLTVRTGEVLNTDEGITTQIEELLDWDFRVNSALVQVHTADRVVHLSGTVGTAAEKSSIVNTAYRAGAIRVDDRSLLVAYWAMSRELRRDKFAHRADDDIAQAIRATFQHDPRVFSSEPLVQVHDGVVTLAGRVSNLRAKQAAEHDARNVVGVRDVHNLLKVRTERVESDGDIRQTILDALARDPYVSHFDFNVNVHNGKVHLYGRVNNYFELEQAGDVAAGVNCVVEMENRVEVLGSTNTPELPTLPLSAPTRRAAGSDPDYALAGRIRLRYRWSATLHDQGVQVQVENGRATLTGTVDTWPDREQAALDAYEVGARDVDNYLRVTTAASL